MNEEREAVAKLLYRYACEAEPDWLAMGPWTDEDWDDLLIESERDEWRAKAMLLIDAIVQLLLPADETAKPDDRLPRVCPKCNEFCVYDGWALVHGSGLGIGSCR